MLNTLAVGNYRSLLNLTPPSVRLNVITGANESTNYYDSVNNLWPVVRTPRINPGACI